MDVLALQSKLKAAGFDPGPLDGINGPRTEFALDSALAAAQRAACGPSDPLVALVSKQLEFDEGRIPHAYQDNLGYWTIGVGRLIDRRRGGKLSDAEIDQLLANDIAAAVADLQALPAWQAVRGDVVRSAALVNMRFQLGSAGLRGFVNSLAKIAAHDWAGAAANLRQSQWARQTPERAARVIRMIETGQA